MVILSQTVTIPKLIPELLVVEVFLEHLPEPVGLLPGWFDLGSQQEGEGLNSGL